MLVCECACARGITAGHGPRGQADLKKLLGPPIVLWAFVGPGGFEHVTGTGWWWKKSFEAPEGFVGFCDM